MAAVHSRRAPARRPDAAAPPRRRLLVLGVLLVLGGAAGYGGELGRQVWSDAAAGRAAFDRGVTALSVRHLSALTPARLATAARDFQRAAQSFARARVRLGRWGDLATAHGGVLPGPFAQLASVGPLLDLAGQSCAVAVTLSEGLRPLAAVLHDPAPASSADAGGLLARSTMALQGVQPALARGAPALPSAVAPLLVTFDHDAPLLAVALRFAPGVPALLGASGPRSYLLVYQDTGDLRATGGFIGAASLLTLDHGRLAQTDYETSGSVDLQLPDSRTGAAPMPLFYYRGLGSFQLRDANFWPDFPTSARAIAGLYRRVSGRRLDGVVAVEPPVVAYLLRGLGPLAIPGFGETLTAANAVGRLDYYVHDRPGAVHDPHRGRFVVAVNHAVLNALLQGGTMALDRVLPELEHAFADRAIMASIGAPMVARALRQAHWDGALRDGPGDYLGVFDQNVTDSKVNPFITQEIVYDAVRRPDGSLDGRVTITYANHTGRPTAWTPRTYYEDYLRLAVPAGARLGTQVGFEDTFWPAEVEQGRRLFPGGLLVPRGRSRTVAVTYVLPRAVLAGLPGYRLVVQKQPGSSAPPLTVGVHDGSRVWTARVWLTHDVVFTTSWGAPPGRLSVQTAAAGPAGGPGG